MTDIATTDDIFFNRSGMDRTRVEGIVEDALHGSDDGELFLEYNQSEAFVFDDGQLKNASFDTMQGFGLRAIAGETAGYSHASELSEEALKRANARGLQSVPKLYKVYRMKPGLNPPTDARGRKMKKRSGVV